MAHAKNHDYHILPPSIWPFLSALAAFTMLFGAVLWMANGMPWLFWIGFVGVLYCMFGWWSDVIRESNAGDHTPAVRIGLRYGFIMFIMSEVMFFAAWFWSFFKHALYPMNEYVGSTYVPPDFYHLDPLHLPLINTLILLLSGCAVTWAHHELVHGGSRKNVANGLIIAVLLGVLFTAFQAYEYRYLLVTQG
jgi:cytochrome c oxidase subunit 3